MNGLVGRLGGMKLENRIIIEKIEIEKLKDKFWVVVYFNNGTIWIPALIEQALLAQKVARCEKIKYKSLDHDPENMVVTFFERAIKGENVCALANEFKLIHTRAYEKFCLCKKES